MNARPVSVNVVAPQRLKLMATALSAALLMTGTTLMPAFKSLPVFSTAAFAQSTDQWVADAPARVGRVAFVAGGVQSYSEADPQWRSTQLNEPVTSRNSLYTEGNGRVEIRVGPAAFSLDANSQVDISQLDDQVFSSSLVRGSMSVRLKQLDNDDHVVVNTPNGQFELQTAGRYRIDTDANGYSSSVTVFAGRAQALGANGSIQVDAGKSLRFTNTGVGESFMFGAAASTEFDNWTLARDGRYREGQSVKYVSRNMTGYEDLDANGNWASDPDYGTVWYPTTYVTADWAPYRYGRWTWVAPWGWTWVDDAPWGFAPFHYGRWVSIGGRWGWTPGAYVARPVFAPALVGFYGGANFSLSFLIGGGSALGWYPLAPWERYTPGYSRNATYINRVNNITVINPPSRYAERSDFNRVNGATVIRQSDFGDRWPVANLAVRNVPEDFIRHAPLASAFTGLPQRPQPSRSIQNGFTAGQPGRPDFNRGQDARSPTQPDRERREDGNARLSDPRTPRPDAVPMDVRRPQEQRPDFGGQRDQQWRQQREAQGQTQLRMDQQRMDQQRSDQQRFEQQRNDQVRAEQQHAADQQHEQQREQRDQQRQQREFERRSAPVRMEAIPPQQAPQQAPQQVPQQPPAQLQQPPRPRPEQARIEQPRIEPPQRVEQPSAINVEQPPAPPPSRFNQQPQEQKNEHQGNRGGSRFRPPNEQ